MAARRADASRWSPISMSSRRAPAGPAIRSRPSSRATRLYGRGSGDAKASVAAMLYAAADIRGRGRHRRRPAARDLRLRRGDQEHHHGPGRRGGRRDRRRGRRRAHQSRRRHRPAGSHDGGPGGARATSATPATPRPMAVPPTPSLLLARRPAQARSPLRRPAVHPILGRTTVTPDHARGRRQPERHASGRQGGARRAQHAGLDPRGDRARCWSGRSTRRRRDLPSPGALRDAGRLASARHATAGPAGGARRSAVPPAPTGSSSAQADAIKCGPGTSRRSHTADEYVDLPEVTAARRFYARPGPRLPVGALMADGPPSATLWSAERLRIERDCSTTPRARTGPGMRASCAGMCSAVSATSKGCKASGLLTSARLRRLRRGLRRALAAVDAGRLTLGPSQEDVHTAVEDWLTRRLPGSGRAAAHRPLAQRPGRLRSPAVSQGRAASTSTRRRSTLADALLRFAARHRSTLWPGYTHQRRAMPSSVGLLGRALRRRAARHGGSDRRRSGRRWIVRRSEARRATACRCRFGARWPRARSASADSTATWPRCRADAASSRPPCCSGARSSRHELARLSQDVIVYSAEEFGYLILPADLATGSSIMPHKRNPGSLRAHPRARRRGRGRSRRRAPDQGASSPAATTATSSSSRSR